VLRVRVIPTLLLQGESLVKSVQFKKMHYIGDPINTVRIFNELEVDEIVLLDISATKERREPSWKLLEQIASECFMPLAYGGGITSVAMAQKLLAIGYEKVVINTANTTSPSLIGEIAGMFGSQSVIASVDVKKNLFGNYEVRTHAGSQKIKTNLPAWIQTLEQRGAGELLLTSIDRDGTWAGYDIALLKSIAPHLHIPLIASGGAGKIEHLAEAHKIGGASALGVGSMVVFQQKEMGVLVNFPNKSKLKEALA